MKAVPKDEAARLESLLQYQILDTEPEQAFEDLARLAAQICKTPIAIINFIDGQRQWFKAKVGIDINELPTSMGLCPFCIEQGDILVIPDTLLEQQFATNPVVTSSPHLRFYAGVPLITHAGQVIGVLCVADRVPRKISKEQVEGLRAVGRQVISQLELQRNLAQLTRISIRERLLVKIAQHIRQSLNLDEILNNTVSEVRQFLQVDRVFIYRLESDGGGVVRVESVGSGWKSILGSRLKDPCFAESYVQPYKQGRVQATADIYAGGLTQCYVDFLAEFQVRSDLVVPILQGEELWGLLVANHCSQPRHWQELEIDLLKQLATQLAIALQQSQLYEQTQHQVYKEQALNRVIQSIRNSLDLKTIFSTAAYEITQLLKADRAQIVQYLPEQQIWLNVAEYRQNPDLPDALGLKIPDAGNEIAAQLKQLEVVRIDDSSTCEDEINQDLAEIFPGSWLLVPLHFGSLVWGSLGLIRNGQPFCWQDLEVELTKTVADQLAIAIQQSTLFEQAKTEISDRKLAEAALQHSEVTLRSFFDSASMMMGIVELVDNDILHISDNAAAAAFLGLTPAAMQNQLDSIIGMPQQYLHEWITHYREAERRRSPVRFEYCHNTEQQIWLSATVSAIELSSSNRQRFAYVVEDITERKHKEEELRWQEALLRSMANVSPLAFYVVDNRTDTILYFNHRFCEIWGIEHLEEQMQRGKLKNNDIIPSCLSVIADVPAFAEACKPLQSEENRSIIEDEIFLVDQRTIRRFSAQVRDQEDQYFGRLYMFEDITESKRTEKQIKAQAALLDITTDAILVRDLNNQILFWNQGAERLYGWQAEDALGKNVIELLSKEITPQVTQAWETAISKGEWHGELPKVTKSDKQIIVESRWTLVRDQNGPKAILSVDTDITEKKQLEAQFLRAQRLESIGTLASGIAHDLNNVLAPILMSAQLLQMRTADERSQRLLQTMESNAKRGAALVKQVLAFARGVEGKHILVQVRHLISEIRQIVTETFPKSIEFYTEIATDLWSVNADSTQLHQVLMNLCINARDAMPAGGTLTIEAENLFIDHNYAQMLFDASVGSYIVINIADTGIGIPPEIINRIFEPFFTTKELGKGTGLGLSTVIGIIKSHNGFVNVTSEVNKGTQFQVYLPAVKTRETQQIAEIDLPRGKEELIFVIDDEIAMQEITQASLETYNYKVITASDGIEAVALYAQHQNEISLVIVDMMMPIMDGLTTIRTLQKINPFVKIIAVSGLVASDNLIAAKKCLSVKASLSKPYTAQELLKTIKVVLNGK